MNEIYKKSLIFSIILGIEYFLMARIGEAFIYVSLAVLFSIVFYSLNFFKISKNNKENYKFLILPLLFNVGASYYLSIINISPVRLLLGAAIVIGNFYLFVALKKVQNLQEKAAVFYRNLIISLSFITLLLTLSAIFKTYVFLSTSILYDFLPILVVLSVSGIFYFLSYFLAWEYGINTKKFMPYNLVGTLLFGELSLIGLIWVVNYPVFASSQRASLGGLPIHAILLTVVFYLIWGIISHKMDRSLTRKVMTEYLGISILFILILLATTQWLPNM